MPKQFNTIGSFPKFKKILKGKILVHSEGTIMLSENDAAQEIPQFIRFYITYV